jgi:cation diffusion facilitator family transporter
VKQRAAITAVIGGLAIFGIKLLAYFISDSVALLSDALESIVNIAASVLMLFSVRISEIPADRNHEYGHQKVENISSFVEGVLILIAAFLIVQAAAGRLFKPVELRSLDLALGASFFATALNGGLSWFLSRTAGETGSLALEGDAKHLLSDVLSSVGVIAGLLVANFTGWSFMDPVLAIVVAALVFRIGLGLMLKASGGLMDYSCPEEETKIIEVIGRHKSQYIDFHNVKTRRSGDRVFSELHLSVDASLTVEAAHELTDHLEEELRAELPEVSLTIHVEPPAVKGKKPSRFPH